MKNASLLNCFTFLVFVFFTFLDSGNEKSEKSCNSMELINHLESFSTCVFSEDDLVTLLGHGCVTVKQPGRGHYSLIHCYYFPKEKYWVRAEVTVAGIDRLVSCIEISSISCCDDDCCKECEEYNYYNKPPAFPSLNAINLGATEKDVFRKYGKPLRKKKITLGSVNTEKVSFLVGDCIHSFVFIDDKVAAIEVYAGE